MLFIAVTAHMRIQVCLFTTCIITLSQHRRSSVAHLTSRGVHLKPKAPTGNLPKDLTDFFSPHPHPQSLPHKELWVSYGWRWIENAPGSVSNMKNLSQTVWVICLGRHNWLIISCNCGALRGCSGVPSTLWNIYLAESVARGKPGSPKINGDSLSALEYEM
jgi:hypothetical protein